MRFVLQPPRLLPATIGLLAVVLAVKSATLLRATADSVGAWTVFGGPAEAAEKSHGAPAKPHGAPAEKARGAPPTPTAPAATAPAAPVVAVEPPGPPPVSDSEKTVLLELRQRRQDLESREGTMDGREAVLAAAEQKLGGRVGELQALQARLENLETARRQREDAGWQGLVRLYETMRPRDAATIFNELAMPTLLEVVDRMKEAKAGAIMAAMVPDKAREVTIQLSRQRLERSAAPSAANPPRTGG